MSKDDGGKYEDTLSDSKLYIQLQADYTLVKACLAKLVILIPFVNKEAVNILLSMGYKINTTNKAGYIKSLEDANRKSHNILNKLRSLEVRVSKIINPQEKKEQLVLGEMVSSVNFTLGSNYVDQYTPLELYFNYKSLAKKKIESLNRKANG